MRRTLAVLSAAVTSRRSLAVLGFAAAFVIAAAAIIPQMYFK